jgi:hypothetical protein
VISATGLRYGWGLLALAALMMAGGCQTQMTDRPPPSSRRDINAVLADHDDRFLAIPGVVGVYVGLLDDGRTQCLKVMLARRTRESERDIPKRIEGYPVVAEMTGDIRPLGEH